MTYYIQQAGVFLPNNEASARISMSNAQPGDGKHCMVLEVVGEQRHDDGGNTLRPNLEREVGRAEP